MDKRRVYLDHAATTPVDPEVLQAMLPWLLEKFGSASSLHTMGREAREAVEEAREKVAALIGAKSEEITFTSGGTESNNWAITGVAGLYANRAKRHIITSRIEHPSVLAPCRALEDGGCSITYLDVDSKGFVDAEAVNRAIRPDTVLITVMHANNEIGTIQPIEAIGRLARIRGIHFHVDGVQTVGSLSVVVERLPCDSMAFSAHKIYGPKGVGALYLRKGTRIRSLVLGGGQENKLRSGTQAVHDIVGFSKAAELALKRRETDFERLALMRDRLIQSIEANIPDSVLNGPREKRLPNNVNFSFSGLTNDSLVMRLDLAGIYASAGSACKSSSREASHVLLALARSNQEAHESLRLTLGHGTTESDVDYVLEHLSSIVSKMRL